MTIAVCLNCASLKHGAFVECKCGTVPITAIEFCVSATFTDQFPSISLDAMQQLINKCNRNEYWVPSYEKLITHGVLEKYIKDTSYRTLLQTRNSAKRGWFKDEIDMHSIGPDGYKHDILVCGKDVDQKLCKAARQIGDNALYCLWTEDRGERTGSFLSIDLWFLAYDKFAIIDREHSEVGCYLRSLNIWYDELIDEYLERGEIAPQKFA